MLLRRELERKWVEIKRESWREWWMDLIRDESKHVTGRKTPSDGVAGQ